MPTALEKVKGLSSAPFRDRDFQEAHRDASLKGRVQAWLARPVIGYTARCLFERFASSRTGGIDKAI